MLARSLVQPQAEVLPLRILNPSHEKRVVRKGTTVGTISTVEVDSVVVPGNESAGEVEVNLPVHLHDLYDRSLVNLDVRYHAEVKSCLTEFQDVFSTGEGDIGQTGAVKHHISTGDARPIKERPRRHPLVNKE